MTSDTTTTTTPLVAPKRSFGRWFSEVGSRHLVAIMASVFSLFPVVWIVSSAFNRVNNLSSSRLIPRQITLDNFAEIFNGGTSPVGRWMFNSFYVALVAAVLNVLVASFAAYAFSRMRFAGRRPLLTSMLVMQIFPQFLGFVAFFVLAQQIGELQPALGLNTHTYLIMVYTGGAAGFNAFLLKGFLDSIPSSLDEAALIDGASPLDIFFRVIMPLARPMLAVIFMLSFIAVFGEYILASFLLSSTDNYTLPVGLQAFLAEGYNAKWGLLSATALLGALPIVTVFVVAQKQILGGLTAGATKG